MPTTRNPTCAIGVMAKAPQAGRSKTRLSPPLLPEQAALLSAAFLKDTTENIEVASRSAAIASYAAYAPLGAEDVLRAHVCAGTVLLLADGNMHMPEGVVGFGRCLAQAIQGMLTDGHAAACVLSSDCPSLPTRLLSEAAAILLEPGDHGVLGATQDGGYYLLGLKAPHAHLFRDISWSTSRVADETRMRASEIGLALTELDMWYDVDDAASLAVLLDEKSGYAAPRTNDVIRQLDLRALPQFRATSGVAG